MDVEIYRAYIYPMLLMQALVRINREVAIAMDYAMQCQMRMLIAGYKQLNMDLHHEAFKCQILPFVRAV